MATYGTQYAHPLGMEDFIMKSGLDAMPLFLLDDLLICFYLCFFPACLTQPARLIEI